MNTRSHEETRVAVVGAGRMGSDHIARITKNISGARVSAVVEPDADRGEAAVAVAPGCTAFASLGEAIEADEADAVLIATPGAFHAPVLRTALEAGLPIFCEKPLTPDSESSREILELEQKVCAKPHIQIGFMRRFDPEYQQMKKLISSGDSGELMMLHCTHRNPAVPESYVQEALINDSLVHEFDVVPWLAGSRAVSIEVKYPRSNSLTPQRLREPILALLELENGVLADVEMNVSAQFGYQVTTEAVFEQGPARIGDPSGLQLWSQGRASRSDHAGFETRFAAAFDAQIQRWIDAVRNGRLVDGANAWDGYLVALCCEAGVEALKTSGPVSIEASERPAFYS